MTGDEFRERVYTIILHYWPIHDGCQKAAIKAGVDDEALSMIASALQRMRGSHQTYSEDDGS